jgi:hypothetical protein
VEKEKCSRGGCEVQKTQGAGGARKAEKKEPAVSEVTPSPVPAPEEREIPVTESSAPEETPVEVRAEARFAGMSPHEAFAYALEEIKDVIRAEFRALRAEIRLWRESK